MIGLALEDTGNLVTGTLVTVISVEVNISIYC